MASDDIPVLWLAVDKRLVGGYKEQRKVCLDGASSLYRWHFGLCKSDDDAMQRSERLTGFPASKQSHVLLEIKFTEAGWAYYSSTSAGKEYYFVSLLHQKADGHKSDVDPGHWRFHTDIPLDSDFVVTTWHEGP